ncbi:MAG: hypothetical protein ACFCA4_12640 [Cyanophyceae cyanobacterium]
MPSIDTGKNSPQWQEVSDSSLSVDGPRNIRIVGPVPSITLPEATPSPEGGTGNRWVIENTSPIPAIVRPTALNTGVAIVRPNEPTTLSPVNIGGVVVNPGETAYVYEQPETWGGTLLIPDPADLKFSVYAMGFRVIASIDGEYSGSRLGIRMLAIAHIGGKREITKSVTGLRAAATMGWRWSGGVFEVRLRATSGIGGTTSRFRSILSATARASIGSYTARTKTVTGLRATSSIGGSTKQFGYIGKLSALASIGGFTARNNVPASTVIFLMHARGYSATLWDAQQIGNRSSSTEQVLYFLNSSRIE